MAETRLRAGPRGGGGAGEAHPQRGRQARARRSRGPPRVANGPPEAGTTTGPVLRPGAGAPAGPSPPLMPGAPARASPRRPRAWRMTHRPYPVSEELGPRREMGRRARKRPLTPRGARSRANREPGEGRDRQSARRANLRIGADGPAPARPEDRWRRPGKPAHPRVPSRGGGAISAPKAPAGRPSTSGGPVAHEPADARSIAGAPSTPGAAARRRCCEPPARRCRPRSEGARGAGASERARRGRCGVPRSVRERRPSSARPRGPCAWSARSRLPPAEATAMTPVPSSDAVSLGAPRKPGVERPARRVPRGGERARPARRATARTVSHPTPLRTVGPDSPPGRPRPRR